MNSDHIGIAMNIRDVTRALDFGVVRADSDRIRRSMAELTSTLAAMLQEMDPTFNAEGFINIALRGRQAEDARI